MDQARARSSLALYFAILTPLSLFGYWLWIVHNQHLALIFAPAASMALTRLAGREGFSDVSFRLPREFLLGAFLAAFLLPLIVCLIAYGGVWAAGAAEFAPATLPKPFPSLANPFAHFAWTILLSLTVVTLFFLPLAAGEEFGWRGHMLPRMVDAGVPLPLFVSAIIWGLWHLPLILSTTYGPAEGTPALASLMFLVSAVAYGWFLGKLRMSTSSVWPSVLAHAVWNALTQACFNPAVKPQLSPLLGESGIIVAVVLAITVACFSSVFAREYRTKISRTS